MLGHYGPWLRFTMSEAPCPCNDTRPALRPFWLALLAARLVPCAAFGWPSWLALDLVLALGLALLLNVLRDLFDLEVKGEG
jgi:hypothetical protein